MLGRLRRNRLYNNLRSTHVSHRYEGLGRHRFSDAWLRVPPSSWIARLAHALLGAVCRLAVFSTSPTYPILQARSSKTKTNSR